MRRGPNGMKLAAIAGLGDDRACRVGLLTILGVADAADVDGKVGDDGELAAAGTTGGRAGRDSPQPTSARTVMTATKAERLMQPT